MRLSFRQLQAILIAHGFAMPKFGADGMWGTETAEALKRWAGSAELLDLSILDAPPEPPLRPTIEPVDFVVPPAWIPTAKMRRVITHWTAGTHKASEYERTHYHILVEGDGNLVRGTHSIKDNESTKGGYAAHTLNCNTGSIGVSLCASAGATEVPYNPGVYPVTVEQWRTLVVVVAQLCDAYDIPVSRETVLSHCEVPKNLGIAQKSKWDIARVPFLVETWTALGDRFREAVKAASS